MRREIRSRLEPLRAKPYVELKELPECSGEGSEVEGIGVELWLYREGSAPDPLEIIVQLTTEPEPFYFGFQTRQVVAEGFRAFPDETTVDMAEKELYLWM
jgi:hypothetical protein